MARIVHAQPKPGDTYGRLTVTTFSYRDSDSRLRVSCTCSCGVQVSVVIRSLRTGATKSCGCLNSETARARKHIPIGATFGELTVTEVLPPIGKQKVVCRCSCGEVKTFLICNLRNGHTKSCGCLRSNLAAVKKTTHGMSNLAEYGVWLGMRNRCLNPKVSSYPRYGGRGVTFCASWRDFENFFRDMGKRPTPRHSLERLDNDAGYCPSNCTWATAREQALNRSSSIRVQYAGFDLPFKEAVRLAGLTVSLVNHRRKKGIPEAAWFLPRKRALSRRKGTKHATV